MGVCLRNWVIGWRKSCIWDIFAQMGLGFNGLVLIFIYLCDAYYVVNYEYGIDMYL